MLLVMPLSARIVFRPLYFVQYINPIQFNDFSLFFFPENQVKKTALPSPNVSNVTGDVNIKKEGVFGLGGERTQLHSRNKRFLSYPRYVEVMVTADAKMVHHHGQNLQHYVLTLMSIVSTVIGFFSKVYFMFIILCVCCACVGALRGQKREIPWGGPELPDLGIELVSSTRAASILKC